MSSTDGRPGPGWYPDPYREAPLRWWDGTAWQAHVSGGAVAPAASALPYAAERRPLPADTPVYTPWIWLVVLLPLAGVLLMFVGTPVSTIAEVMRNAGTGAVRNMTSLYSPMYLVTVAAGWLAYGLTVVFAWLDHRDLGRRGLDRPFHWAWSFLAPQVYSIGRSVIVRRTTGGRGAAPLWATIVVTVVVLAASIGYTMMIMGVILQNLPAPHNVGA